MKKKDDKSVHMAHCYQGEYAITCKYSEKDCPAKPKKEQLRVWHIPQVPMKAFYVKVTTIKEAIIILNVLADYDTFQFENKIKPDYSNASGLGKLVSGQWCEYYDDEDNDIWEIIKGKENGNME